MKHLDPKALWLFFIRLAFRWTLFLVVVRFWILADVAVVALEQGYSIPLNLFWPMLIIVLALCWIWAKLSYGYFLYELTENGFRKESGVIYKRYVTIPYERIQNVDIYRGILARILGLSDLHIQTAGASALVTRRGTSGMHAEGRLPALSRAEAEQLRDELIRRARGSKAQGV